MRKGIATRSCSRSTSSAASSAATARRCVRRRRFTSAPLRELRVQPRPVRLRPRAAHATDASGVRDVGSRGPQGRVMGNELPSLFYSFHFYLFGLVSLASAIVFVTRKSPVAAAMWLVVTMFALAALYVLLDAQFIAAIQILVNPGAIRLLFLLVIMLPNLGKPSRTDLRGWVARGVAVL